MLLQCHLAYHSTYNAITFDPPLCPISFHRQHKVSFHGSTKHSFLFIDYHVYCENHSYFSWCVERCFMCCSLLIMQSNGLNMAENEALLHRKYWEVGNKFRCKVNLMSSFFLCSACSGSLVIIVVYETSTLKIIYEFKNEVGIDKKYWNKKWWLLWHLLQHSSVSYIGML